MPGKDLNLPLVKVTIENHEWVALLDTGASRSFIHPVCAGYFRGYIRRIRRYHFSCASGKEVSTNEGIPNLKVTLGNQELYHDFLIACVGYDVLIGFDLLQKAGMVDEFLSLAKESQGQWVEAPLLPGWKYEEREEEDSGNNRKEILFEEPIIQLTPKTFEEDDIPEDNLPALTWSRRSTSRLESSEKKQLRKKRERSNLEVRDSDTESEIVPPTKKPSRKTKRSLPKTRDQSRKPRRVERRLWEDEEVPRDEEQPFHCSYSS